MGLLRWWFWNRGYRLIHFIPWPLLVLLGNIGGALQYHKPSALRTIVHNNMASVFPEKTQAEIAALVKKWFQSMAKFTLEELMFLDFEGVPIHKIAEHRNLHYVPEALQHGKGLITFSAHTCSFGVYGKVMYVNNFPAYTVLRAEEDIDDDPVTRRFDEIVVNEVWPKGREGRTFRRKGAAKKFIELLTANQRILIVSDGPVMADLPVKFLGHTVKMPSGLIRLALKTGAPMVPIMVKRLPNEKTLVEAFEPILVEPSGDIEADVARYAPVVFSHFEKLIRENPQDWWLWPKFHERWLDNENANVTVERNQEELAGIALQKK